MDQPHLGTAHRRTNKSDGDGQNVHSPDEKLSSTINSAQPPASQTPVPLLILDTVWLSVADAVAYCASKGLHRNIKTVRRWAHRSVAHPETAEVLAQKQDTDTDFRYVIERDSLDVKIAQELAFEAQQTSAGIGGHALSRLDTPVADYEGPDIVLLDRTGANMPGNDRTDAGMGDASVGRDKADLLAGPGANMSGDARPREGVGGAATDEHGVASKAGPAGVGDDVFLKEQIAEKDRQIGNLYRQLERRDEQIMAMLERDRETNILIKGLQEALLPASTASLDGRPARRLDVRSESAVRNDGGDKTDEREPADGVY